MNRGLFIGATSLLANQRRMEVLSNNLANVNTTGYKKDIALTESFPEKLLLKIRAGRPGIRSGEDDFSYEVSEDVHVARTSTGYFVVGTPGGNSYVKEIRFTIDDEGYLRTFYRDGREDLNTDNENYILDMNGNPLQAGAGDIGALLQNNIQYPPSPVIGTISAGVNFQKIVTDFTPGEIMETGGVFDLALSDSGFFRVADQDGNIYYTRDGSFTLNENGQLVTSTGYIVQCMSGPINIGQGEVVINKRGQVLVDGNVVDSLNIVDLENREFLRKIGDNLYIMEEGVEPEEIPYEGEVLQGYLESSNVNAINELVEMISLLREFEMGQKLIRMQDEMLEKAVNELGRI